MGWSRLKSPNKKVHHGHSSWGFATATWASSSPSSHSRGDDRRNQPMNLQVSKILLSFHILSINFKNSSFPNIGKIFFTIRISRKFFLPFPFPQKGSYFSWDLTIPKSLGSMEGGRPQALMEKWRLEDLTRSDLKMVADGFRCVVADRVWQIVWITKLSSENSCKVSQRMLKIVENHLNKPESFVMIKIIH